MSNGEGSLRGSAEDVTEAILSIRAELAHARAKFPAYHSAHEGYAVIAEELDELWDEVKRQHQDAGRMRAEAIQVAATALRFVLDVTL